MSRLGSIVSLMLQGFQQSLSMHLWWSNGVESLWSLGLHHPKRASRFPHSAFIMMRLPSSVQWRFSSHFNQPSTLSVMALIITKRSLKTPLPFQDFLERSPLAPKVQAARDQDLSMHTS